MQTGLDCMVCLIRQSLEAARWVTPDTDVHEKIMRDVLGWASNMDMQMSPPAMAQRIHRHLRTLTGIEDPYQDAKDQMNQTALALLPELREMIDNAADPLSMALRLAIAGNVIDLGTKDRITESDIRQAVRQAAAAPLCGSEKKFKQSVDQARTILYLADNAGEIVFDRLLIEQLDPQRITLAVRGAPVLNDATIADAEVAGLSALVKVIDNGSDAPGTLLDDCRRIFLECFHRADLILSKGQGNFESLSDTPRRNIFYLFKAKCTVIAAHIGQPQGTHMLIDGAAW